MALRRLLRGGLQTGRFHATSHARGRVVGVGPLTSVAAASANVARPLSVFITRIGLRHSSLSLWSVLGKRRTASSAANTTAIWRGYSTSKSAHRSAQDARTERVRGTSEPQQGQGPKSCHLPQLS